MANQYIPERGVFKRRIEVQTLSEILRRLQENELVTRQTLEQAVGLPRDTVRAILVTVFRHLEREDMVFEAVRSIGYKRCDPAGASNKAKSHSSRATRADRRALRVGATVDFNRLDQQQKVTHATVMAISGLRAHIATKRGELKQLALKNPTETPSLASSLEAIRRLADKS
jgi:hypothetical protein